jgi:hypothetical protein
MNEIISSILKIYITTSVVYFIYRIYLHITKAETLEDLINSTNNTLIIDRYNKMKKKKIVVVILGILLGIGILILTQSSPNDIKMNNKAVYDISDIRVI